MEKYLRKNPQKCFQGGLVFEKLYITSRRIQSSSKSADIKFQSDSLWNLSELRQSKQLENSTVRCGCSNPSFACLSDEYLPKRKRVHFSDKLEFKKFFNNSTAMLACGSVSSYKTKRSASLKQMKLPSEYLNSTAVHLLSRSTCVNCLPQNNSGRKQNAYEEAVWISGNMLCQTHANYAYKEYGRLWGRFQCLNYFKRINKCARNSNTVTRDNWPSGKTSHENLTDISESNVNPNLSSRLVNFQMDSVYTSDDESDEGYVGRNQYSYPDESPTWEGYETPFSCILVQNCINGRSYEHSSSLKDGNSRRFYVQYDGQNNPSQTSSDTSGCGSTPVSPNYQSIYEEVEGKFDFGTDIKELETSFCGSSQMVSKITYNKKDNTDPFVAQFVHDESTLAEGGFTQVEKQLINKRNYNEKISELQNRASISFNKLTIPCWMKKILKDDYPNKPNENFYSESANVETVLPKTFQKSRLPRFPRYLDDGNLCIYETINEYVM